MRSNLTSDGSKPTMPSPSTLREKHSIPSNPVTISNFLPRRAGQLGTQAQMAKNQWSLDKTPNNFLVPYDAR